MSIRKRYGKFYTELEDAIVRAEYHKGRAYLAHRLGRTVPSIQGRAFRLGITGRPSRPARLDPWPQDPIERAHAVAEEVQRRRDLYAARVADYPLERWLEEYEQNRWWKAHPVPKLSSREEIAALFRGAL